MSFFSTCFLFEEEHICLYSIRIEYPCRKSQDSMEITIMKYFLSDNLTCTSLKEYIIWEDDSSSPIHFKQCMNMLNEIQLFIARCSPKIWSLYSIILFSFFSIFSCEFVRTFCTEWRIRQNNLISRSWIFDETVSYSYRTLCLSDPMEKHIHHSNASCLCHELLSTEDTCF